MTINTRVLRSLLILWIAGGLVPFLHGANTAAAEEATLSSPGADLPAGWWAAAQGSIAEDMSVSNLQGLSQNPDWSAVGADGGDEFGFSVAGVGDVNGDGYADVMVGAPGFATLVGQGKAYAFYGSPAGLSTVPDWEAYGVGNGGFGYAVAAAGDVNGDGYADVVVSSPLYGAQPGRIYIYYGSPSGLSSDDVWLGEGGYDGDHFGISVAGAGDVNGDGYADVIAGANYDGEDFTGSACVYHGSATGPGTSCDWSVEGESDYFYLGYSVTGAGDVNGDGYADVAISSMVYFEGRGIVYVYMGSSGGLETSPDWTKMGENAGDWFGRSVAGAGDLNGDGFSDLAVGADGYYVQDGNDGKVYVFYGSRDCLAHTEDVWYRGLVPSQEDRVGRSVASAGDVNGDGYADLVIGATERAKVLYGAAEGLNNGWPDWWPWSENDGDKFGYAVTGAGDVNGDGYADVMVGAQGYLAGADQGKAYVYHGAGSPFSPFAGWSVDGTNIADRLGRAVASAGDVNGDGYSDLLVGAPGYPGSPGRRGKVYLYLGASGGPATTAAWSAEGEYDGDWFGAAVAAAGDVNGDGYGDVIIGAWQYDNGAEVDAGKVYLYLGSVGGLQATWDWSITGEVQNLNLGAAVAAAGDVNGDGYADVIVGASENQLLGRGTAQVYYGSEDGLSPGADWTVTGQEEGIHLGAAVAGAGDVNGDGYADVAVGAPGFWSDHGQAQVYYGGAAGLESTPAWSAQGEFFDDEFGTSLASAGDVNGDGYADLIVGAYAHDADAKMGKAYVYTGSASGLGDTAGWSASGLADGDQFSYSVAGAGDVNGDGYADVVVGAPHYSSAGVTSRGRIAVYLGSAVGLASTAASSAQGAGSGDELGYAVAGAGDLNGDGFADVVAGAPFRDAPEDTSGTAYVYFGNVDPGRAAVPRQARADGSRWPVQPWGSSQAVDRLYLTMRATHPMGRGRVKVEVEACPQSVAFGHAPCVRFRSAQWRDVTATPDGTLIAMTISGLENGTVYRWRARVLHAPFTVARVVITPPPNPAHSPWRRFQAQTFEADIRTESIPPIFLPLVLRGS